jgi:hypothetical protein
MSHKIRGHQGDVQFFSIDKIPTNAVKIKNKPIAYGEHSGHQHILTGDVEMFEVDGRIIVAVGGDGARLQHIHESNMRDNLWTSTAEIQVADHKSHLLPAGNYEFFIQNSYNPYTKALEASID